MSSKKKLTQKELLKEQNNVLKSTSNLSLEQVLKKKIDALNKLKIVSKVKEKSIKGVRNHDDMFHYTFLFKLKDIDYSTIDKDTFKRVGNRIRTKVRKQRNSFANNIILYKNNKDIELLTKEIKSFNKFYKETYKLNDYTLKSISSTNRDEDTNQLLKDMLSIIMIMK